MRKLVYIYILLLIICVSSSFNNEIYGQPASSNQEATSDPEINLNSPYGAVFTHLKYLQDDSFRPDLSAKPFLRSGISQERAEELAIKLYQYYNAKGFYIDLEQIPREPNYFDSTKNKASYEVVPLHHEIYVEKVGNSWLYSNQTIGEVDRLHKETFPFGTDRLLALIPEIGQDKYFGLYLWQLLGLLAIIFVGLVLHKIFTFSIEIGLFKILAKYGYTDVGRKYLLPVAKPFSYFLLIAFALVFVRILQLPVESGRFIIRTLNILQPLAATIVFYKLVDVFGSYLKIMAEKTESTLDDQLVPLAQKTLKFFVVIVGSLIILREGLNVDIWPILTGLSIGGLAVALAAQDTLKNFFGSIMIFIDKPFQIGHWITSGDIDGTVEEVGFRSTRIRTFRNSLMYVPNAKLADSMVDNHGLRVYRRFFTTITVTYDTPPALLELFVEGLRAIVEKHPDTRKDTFHIYFNDLGSHSLNIMFYIFFTVPTWGEELRARHEVLIEVMKLAETLGVRFAFPTQTLHLEEIPGHESLTPIYPTDKTELRSRLDAYYTGAKTENKSIDKQ